MRILLIAEHIAPEQSVASIRWTKLGKYLAREGHEFVALTNEKSDSRERKDVKFVSFNPAFAADAEEFAGTRTFRNNFWLRMLYTVLHTIVPPKETTHAQLRTSLSDTSGKRLGRIAQFIKDLLTYRSSRSLCRKLAGDFDLVIASYGPIWTLLSGEYIKRRNPGVIWIADYRDSPASVVFGPGGDFRMKFARKHTKTVDAIISVSDSVLDEVKDDRVPCCVVTNGFDPEEVSARQRQSSETFDLVYTGTLYSAGEAQRDMRALLGALNELVVEGKIAQEDIRVRYAGYSEAEFAEQISGFSKVPHESQGFIPRVQALAMQDAASLLILLTWNTTSQKGVLTGKLFEYMSSGVPIVCLSSGNCPDSQVKQVLEETGTGFCYEEARDAEDREALKVFLLQKYEEWKQEGFTRSDRDEASIQCYSHPALAKQVVSIAESLR